MSLTTLSHYASAAFDHASPRQRLRLYHDLASAGGEKAYVVHGIWHGALASRMTEGGSAHAYRLLSLLPYAPAAPDHILDDLVHIYTQGGLPRLTPAQNDLFLTLLEDGWCLTAQDLLSTCTLLAPS